MSRSQVQVLHRPPFFVFTIKEEQVANRRSFLMYSSYLKYGFFIWHTERNPAHRGAVECIPLLWEGEIINPSQRYAPRDSFDSFQSLRMPKNDSSYSYPSSFTSPGMVVVIFISGAKALMRSAKASRELCSPWMR